jgi:hypothetical protein
MKKIDFYYQGEGVHEIQHLEVSADQRFADIKSRLAEGHGFSKDTLVFLEDSDEPIDEQDLVSERACGCSIKAHFHRCRQIEVQVTFNGKTAERRFGPGTTVARVKRWAAEREFCMSPEEASEHVLQLAGTHDRPAPGTHIGSLTSNRKCRLAFDLLPDERINGGSEVRL